MLKNRFPLLAARVGPGWQKVPDFLPIFLRTENCQWPNNILETESISESIICVQRENLSIRPGAEDRFWQAFGIFVKICCGTLSILGWMEQRVIVKYFFLNGRRSKLIHNGVVSTLQDNAVSLSTVTNSLRRSKSGDLSCGDEERPGRRLISWDRLFSAF
jgi:hypothetical protein